MTEIIISMVLRWVILISIIVPGYLSAQDFNIQTLYGHWNVRKYTSLEVVTPGMENKEEQKDRINSYQKILKKVFIIDSNGISTKHKDLEFDSCTLGQISQIVVKLKIVENNFSLGYASYFDIDLDSSRASKEFVKFIANNYRKKQLDVLTTSCPVKYGNETLAIVLIAPDIIALYRGFDVIVFERKKSR